MKYNFELSRLKNENHPKLNQRFCFYFRVAYIKTSDDLNNVSVIVKNAAGLTDVYFVPENPFDNLAVSAYMELPARMYCCNCNIY